MYWIVKQLASPVAYLKIRQGTGLLTSKYTYDVVVPLVGSVICTTVVCYFSLPIAAFGTDGLVPGILNLLNLLIAFFIAALAAVATFDRKGLDDAVKGDPALMKRTKANGARIDHVLTHRQFVCYMFGFLSFASLMLLIGLYALRVVGPGIWSETHLTLTLKDVSFNLRPWFKAIGLSVFFFVIGQIVTTTLLSLYFLTDRLQFMSDPAD
ncbi:MULTISPECIES: hypothetical protein [unclassified Sphingomonas]|uniref:hypothetical protein n=1 Tax=Sphingomonas sp. PvP015 TaxID=3156388 RepID=UPI003391D647